MLKISSSLFVSIGIAILFSRCVYHTKAPVPIPLKDSIPCDSLDAVKYSAVATIFEDETCISCHDAGQTSPNLSTYSTTKAYISANEAKFLKAINQQNSDVNKNMPQGAVKMPADNLKNIETWICQGMNP